MSSARSTARQAAPVFAALGDPTRLGLVRRLSDEGPLSITRLSEGTGITRQAITRHLEALEQVGLVRDSKHGRERVFSLDLKRLELARQYLDHVSAQWDDAAARLKQFVEDDDALPLTGPRSRSSPRRERGRSRS